MSTNSLIELNRSAYQANIDFLKKTMGKKVVFSSVVKGNAYGHGIEEFVVMAYQCGVRHFSVFDVEEAKSIYAELQDTVTILIMGALQEKDMEWVIGQGIEFFVFDKTRLTKVRKIAEKLDLKAKVHIEVETGMNRTGFEKSEWRSVAIVLKKEKEYLYFKGLCTHYAGAESVTNYSRVTKQIARFEEAYQYFCLQGITSEIRHSACSAAAMMYPETQMDLVRIGIMQYGLWPSPEVFASYLKSKKIKTNPLERVITWKSSIMSLKNINAGTYIGYGTSYLAKRKMKIAVIPIGYAHGYSRSLSNQGRVLINGHSCSVVGSVNMNMISVDVTEVERIKKEAEVVVIGAQKDLAISVASFSDSSNQLNYELLTRISKTIPRKIIQ